VVVYVAQDCHLCRVALDVVRDVCGASFATVDIGGSPDLEARFRTRIPVVEVDGEEQFTYFVQPAALREALGG
jgi:hypothetical protein